MATHAPIMGAPSRAPFLPAPPIEILKTLSRFKREHLAAFIEVAIDLLDLADSDPDLEDDDPDCCLARDDTGGKHPLDGYGDGRPGDPDDREEDDPAGDIAHEDEPGGYMQDRYRDLGPGCQLSDTGLC